MKENATGGTKACEVFSKAKSKMVDAISSMKTKEGREAFAAKVKKAAIAAKDKTVVLWESGPKGKAAVIGAALVLAWLVLPFGGDESSAALKNRNDDRAMASAGLKKIHDGDAMFYESGEKFKIDDNSSYDIVKPNLYVLPPFIKSAFLETAVYPTFEKDNGDAFAPRTGTLEVKSVGNGYVLVGIFNSAEQKWHYAFVTTDDEYVDEQPLKEGFYAYVGTQTVPMTDGSSHTMPAFEKLPDVYLEAVAYNLRAEEAADVENDRRNDEAQNKEDASAKDAISKMVLEMAKDTEEKDLAERVHIPAKLQAKAKVRLEPRWKWFNDPSRTSDNFLSRDEFVARTGKGELPYFLATANRYDTKERMREEVEDNYRRYRVVAEIPSDSRLDVYTIHPREGVKLFVPQYNSEDLFDAMTHVAVVEAPEERSVANPEEASDGEYDKDGNWNQRPEDPLRAFQTRDVGKFMEAYEKIYGK